MTASATSMHAAADLAALRVALDSPAPRLPDALRLLEEAVRTPALDDAEVRWLVNERLNEIGQDEADLHTQVHRERPGHRSRADRGAHPRSTRPSPPPRRPRYSHGWNHGRWH